MHALSLPFIDADRMNKPAPGNGKRLSNRARFAVAFGVLVVIWLFLRLNHYFMR
jgi:hypothetical protein